MNKLKDDNLVSHIAMDILTIASHIADADIYQFYLYNDLFIPVASYYKDKTLEVLENRPSAGDTPMSDYIQKFKVPVHNYMPEVRKKWENSVKRSTFDAYGLKYTLAAPMYYSGHWIGSFNMARRNQMFGEDELEMASAVASLMVLALRHNRKELKEGIFDFDIVSGGNLKNKRDSGDTEVLLRTLTTREVEILHLLLDGKSYSDISQELYISLNTVKHHVKNVYRKLHINSRVKLMHIMNVSY
ncbi:LuxR C-terminal-related transcriptional regulator [Blautia schinkii]|nr:LuxR C-terminal-related transcriptional regulator [Blautia schinkii]